MERIKIVMICHFSNPQIRKCLDLYKGRFYSYSDFGLWNVNIIEGLKDRLDIELHVIAPHIGMKHNKQEFVYDNVFYHFFRTFPFFPIGNVLNRLKYYEITNYCGNRKLVKKFINDIKPDLVNLIGAENPYYSITALDVEGVPLFIHCQTVYANPERFKHDSNVNKKRWSVELQLFQKTPYFACTGKMYYDLIKGYQEGAIIFPRRWPATKFPCLPDVQKKYDFVYFARNLNRNKGFDNAIEAMGLALKKHPEMRFLAIGTFDEEKPYFEKRIKELNINDSLCIIPSFKERLDMLMCAKQGRFALLPITMDVISGTIFESMRMGMPVVTCRTSGTPSLNERRETVLISDIGDVDGLYQNMLRLYESPELQKQLQVNAELYLREKDEENAHNIDIMQSQYLAVINHYNNGIEIPKELLFSTENNKNYRNQ